MSIIPIMPRTHRGLAGVTLTATVVLTASVAGATSVPDDDATAEPPTTEAPTTSEPTGEAPSSELSITIAHINDHHSHLQPGSGSADLGTEGGEFDYELGGFPRVAAQIGEIEGRAENVVKVHAGDAITGTLFYTLFAGEADAALMNDVCFDVFELGNHEFDDTDVGLVTFLDYLNDSDCGTVTLGANVVPAPGTPLLPAPPTQYVRPYHIVEYGDEQVGFIGLDIAGKTTVSSSPLETTTFLD